MKRIFVRGMSRSGGTLMATVLDAHPDISMCYEVYEHLLEPKPGERGCIDRLVALLEDATEGFAISKTGKLKKIDDANLNKFVFRAMRAGIEADALLTLMKRWRAAGGDFATFEDRMDFIQQLGLYKCQREDKIHWGTKIGGIFRPLQKYWPDAYFLFMLRDGRDVAASRQAVGDFGQGIEHIAMAWRDQIQNFLKFTERKRAKTHLVRYEQLVTDPQPALQAICDFLDVPFSDRLMSFHDQDLTIYKNPTGHLSRDQVSKPINAGSLGRWKRDLSPEDLAAFEAEAGGLMTELGYELAGNVVSNS